MGSQFLKAAARNIVLHIRLGYVAGLLLALIPFFVLGLLDIIRYWRLDLGFGLPIIETISNIDFLTFIEFFSTLIVAAIVIPIVVAIFRVSPFIEGVPPSWLGGRGRWVVFIYAGSWILISALSQVLSRMEVFSGAIKKNGAMHLSFESWLRPFLFEGSKVMWKIAIPLSMIFIEIIVVILLHDRGRGAWSKAYLARAKLADLRSDYYPVHGRHILNFNGGSIAPSIRSIRKKTMALMDEYQEAVPGSQASRRFLEDKLFRLRNEVCHLFEGAKDLSESRIFFYESTTRALSACIVGYPAPRRLFISPWEHPSELRLAEELKAAGVVEIQTLDLDGDMIIKETGRAEKIFSTEVRKKLLADGCNIVLISEVCWATGGVIDVDRVKNMIRGDGSGPKFKFLVDGAHSVGNLKRAGIKSSEAFFFSGHKWILSSYPCGVAVISDVDCRPITYDAWTDECPMSTGNPGTILGLLSALEVGKELRDSILLPRARELKARFLYELGSEYFDPVVANSNSLLVSIRPRSCMKWRDEWSVIIDELNREGISVCPVEIRGLPAEGRHLLRFSFPYFIDSEDVDRAVVHLRKLVVPKLG